MSQLRLGKQPATEDPRDLAFARYATTELPTPPDTFGHEQLFGPKAWGMLGNDEWGDCAWAGSAHETMLLTKESGHPVTFTTNGVLSDYAAGTGFDQNAGPPGHNKTDNGSNLRSVLKYRAKKGIVDAAGHRHKIGAFVKLNPANLDEVLQAAYIFQAVGIGIEFPTTAMDQFNAGEPWDVVPGAKVDGGHYIPLVGRNGNLQIITWGALQQMTPAFFAKYCDEAWAYVSTEDLDGTGVDPEGFKVEQLTADLKALHG